MKKSTNDVKEDIVKGNTGIRLDLNEREVDLIFRNVTKVEFSIDSSSTEQPRQFAAPGRSIDGGANALKVDEQSILLFTRQ